jgi:hypothetical protein
MTRDSGDLDSACAEVNDDEHVLPHSAQHRPGVDGQEVGREMGGFESAAGAASFGEDGERATGDAVLAGPDSAEGGDGGGRVRGEPTSMALTWRSWQGEFSAPQPTRSSVGGGIRSGRDRTVARLQRSPGAS